MIDIDRAIHIVRNRACQECDPTNSDWNCAECDEAVTYAVTGLERLKEQTGGQEHEEQAEKLCNHDGLFNGGCRDVLVTKLVMKGGVKMASNTVTVDINLNIPDETLNKCINIVNMADKPGCDGHLVTVIDDGKCIGNYVVDLARSDEHKLTLLKVSDFPYREVEVNER